MSTQAEKPNTSEAKKQFNITTKNRKFTPFENEKETQWQGPFSFIQAADTQLGLLEKIPVIEKRPNPGWQQEIEWTRQMVMDINMMEPKPRFLVICGDLINAFPYEAEKADRDLQEVDLKKELMELQVPLVCVCGNHDVGDTPTPQTIEKYKKSFGEDYFSFYCGGVYFLALNSQYWQDSTQAEHLAEEHENWLEEQLQQITQRTPKPKHVIVFQHIPPFLKSADEAKEYFNLPLDIRARILKRFGESGVKYVFCGHYHRNAGGKCGDLEVVVTSAVGAQLGDDTNGYRIVNVAEDVVKHKYVALGEGAM